MKIKLLILTLFVACVSAFGQLSSSPTATPNPICEGQLLTLAANVAGGTAPYTYAWTGPAAFTSSSQNPTIAAVAVANAGIYSLLVTDSLGATVTNSTSAVVVNLKIIPTFETLLLSYCRLVTPPNPIILPPAAVVPIPILPNTSTEGIDGFWSLSPTNIPPASAPLSVDTNPSPIGPFQVTKRYYFYPNASECGQNIFVDIVITRNAIPTFSFPLVYCVGDIVPNLPTNSTNSVGGTWSTVTGAPITKINTSTVGTFQYNFSPNAGLCALQQSFQVTIKPYVTPSFTLPSFICVGATPPVLPTTSTDVPPIAGTWNPPIVSNTTTQTYTFTPTTALGVCARPSTITINVNPIITASTNFSYPSPVCKNAANPSPITGNPFTSGGVYSGSTGLIFVSTSTGQIDLATPPGTYTVTYTVATDTANCLIGASSTAQIIITANTTPTTGFSYTSPVCKNSTPNPLPILATGFSTGGTFSSTTGLEFVSNTTGEIKLLDSTPGTYTITYSLLANTATCQLAGTNTATIVIKPAVVPNGTFSYTTPICQTQASTILAPITPTVYTPGGVFTAVPSGLIIDSASGGIDLTSPANTYTVTYTITPNSTNCFTTSLVTTATIEIRPLIIPVTAFSYVTPICKSSLINPFPIIPSPLTAGGTFSATPSGLVFVSPTTGQINVSASSIGVYTVTYPIPANAATCQIASTGTATIEIKETVVPVSSFSYASPVCQGPGILNPTYGNGYTPGGVFTSTTGLIIDSATGAVTLSSVPGTYTVTNTITPNATNCFTSNSTSTAQITITPLRVPVTGFSYTTPVCQTQTATSLDPITTTGFTFDGTFTASPLGLIINSSTGVINLTSAPGTYTVTYTIVANSTNCFTANAVDTAQIVIRPLVIPVTGFSYTTPVCKNSASTLSPTLNIGFSTGGTFSSVPSIGLVFVSPTTGVINLDTSNPGTYDITYNIPQNSATCQVAGSTTFTVVIKPAVVPVGGFSYVPSVVCQTPTSTNLSPTLVNLFTTGGTFTAVPAGLILNPATGVVDLASAPNTYTVTYTITPNATNCFTTTSVTTATIKINPFVNPITSFTYPTTPICNNNSINPIPTFVNNHTTGGIFSSTAGLNINASTGVITLPSTPGTYVVTYATPADNSICRLAGSSTFTIIINPIITPIVAFTYASPICKTALTASPSLATGFVTGGVFSAVPALAIDPASGVINVQSASTPIGSYTITYTLPANAALCQLAGSSTFNITVNSIIAPNSAFSYVTPVCKNAGTALIVPGGLFTIGGVFSCSNTALALNSSTGAITLGSSPAGTYTVDYTIVATPLNCFSSNSNSSTQITITPSTPSVTGFSYASPVCANATNSSPILNTGFTTGGTFSSTAGLVFVSTATGEISNSSVPGTYVVTYTYLNNTVNCITAGTSTATIVISPAITASTGFIYNTSYCKNDPNPSPSPIGAFTTGGTYSANSTSLVFISSTTGQINLAQSAAGTYIIRYDVLNNTTTCQLAGSSTFSVTINPMVTPTTAFSYTSVICKDGGNQSPTFTTIPYTTGGTFTWTGGPLLILNAVTGIIDPLASTAGTYIIKYQTPANASTCLLTGFSTATIIIKDNILPVNTFSYTTPICKNSPNQSPILAPLFTTGGTFTAIPNTLIINATTGVIDMASPVGTYAVTYNTTANNSTCLKIGTYTTSITIKPVGAAVTAFSYVSPVCKKPGATATPSAAPVTTGGTYIATAGLIINSATGAIDLGSPAGVYSITYNVNFNTTNCLAGTSTFTFEITQPTVPTFAPIVTSICKNELVVPTLSTLSTNGITGTWIPSTITSNVVGAVVYEFTPAATFCATKATITINTYAPTVVPTFATVATSICNGVAAPILPIISTNGFSGTWSPSTVNPTATGTYVFTPTLGICATQKTITINYIPEVVSTIMVECVNANFTLIVKSVSTPFNPGNTYVWKDELGTIIPNSNSTSINVAQHIANTVRVEALPITYSVKITTPEGCTSMQTYIITDIYCEIQKGISPNGDTKNDFFDLTNFDVKQFEVFNRYGVKVYSKESYKREWEGQTDGGVILPDGTYFYNIEFANSDTKTGWVYINKETK